MLRYSDELQHASANEIFFFKPAIEGSAPAETPVNMLICIRAENGEVLLQSDKAVWNADSSRIELRLNLSDSGQNINCGTYSAGISFDCDEEHCIFDCAFDIVPRPWRPNITMADLLALIPSAGYADDNQNAMAALVNEAEEQLRLRIRAAGMTPALIANRAALDQCLRALILSLACQRSSRNAGKDGLWNKHLSWQASYESKWRELVASMRYDGDADGAASAVGRDMAAVRLRP